MAFQLFEKAYKRGDSNLAEVLVENFSVYIHTAHQDAVFKHGVRFPPSLAVKYGGPPKNGFRVAVVCRWLSPLKLFRTSISDPPGFRHAVVDKQLYAKKMQELQWRICEDFVTKLTRL